MQEKTMLTALCLPSLQASSADSVDESVLRDYPAELHWTHTDWTCAAEQFRADLQKIHSVSLLSGKKGIVLRRDSFLPREGYRILAEEEALSVSASTVEGLNRAFATLLQLVEKTPAGFRFPMGLIQEEAGCAYRGLMIDLGRFWHPLERLLDYVDLCHFYKIGMLHLHFSEGERYTLPCDAYPLLPTPGYHYTKEEIARLTDYAYAKGVSLMPEIEVPGHCIPFQQAYPELFGSSGVLRMNEKVWEALRTIFGEVCQLFPHSSWIHIGGDEAAVQNWRNCPETMAYARENGFSVEEENAELPEQLYTHFVVRMTNIVRNFGKIPVVWEGFHAEGNGELSKDVVVMSWENYYQTTPDLLQGGFRVVNCSWRPMYVVAPEVAWNEQDILNWTIYYWDHWWEKSFAKDGFAVEPSDQILGGQICAWGDNLMKYLPEDQPKGLEEEFLLVRRHLAACAEKTWNIRSALTVEDFRSRFRRLDGFFDRLVRR